MVSLPFHLAVRKSLIYALALLIHCATAVASDFRPVTVQLNWRHQFEFAAFYAAIAQGYYRDEGLTVSLREGGPSVGAVDEVVAGKADFGVANSSLVLERHRGKPVIALAALMQHSAIVLLARRDRGIHTVRDLDGKRISCPPHTCDEIKAYLLKSGLKLERIHFSLPSQPSALGRLTGEVDATEAFFTNESYHLRGHEHEIIQFTPQSAGIDLFGDVLFTTDALLDQDPDTVKRFRAATLKGLTYAMAHQDELVALIVSRYNTQKKSPEHLRDEASRLQDLIRTDLVEAGYMSAQRWGHVRSVYADLAMLPADYDLVPFIYDPAPPIFSPWVKSTILVAALVFLVVLAALLQLGRINLKLRREVRARRATEAALHQSQAAFRSLVEHANTLLSHELRTPLAVVKIQADILEHKLDQGDPAGRNIQVLRQAVLRLEELFGTKLRQMFSATSLVSERQHLELQSGLRGILGEFGALWPDARMTVAYALAKQQLLEVVASPEMLKTAILNLLENALKYATPGSRLNIELHQEFDQAVVTVSNFYDGTMPPDLEVLFKKNTRGDPGGSVQGTGVGLYLVRLIAQAHGGNAYAEITSAGLFAVHFTLPLAHP